MGRAFIIIVPHVVESGERSLRYKGVVFTTLLFTRRPHLQGQDIRFAVPIVIMAIRN